MQGGCTMINIRIMHGKYDKDKDYDLFGYTYIKAEPKETKKESASKQKEDDPPKTFDWKDIFAFS